MLSEYEFADRLMGCELHISLICTDKSQAKSLYREMYALGTLYENTFSRFLPTSELSVLNAKKSLIVSPLFFDVFLVARQMHDITHGVFNPLVQIAQHGYNKTFVDIDKYSSQAISHPSYSTDFLKIIFSHNTRRLSLEKTQKLDFGGFLKGYVAQKMASYAKDVHGVIVNIGGDIYTYGSDPNNKVFLFDIYNPYTKSDFADIPLHNQSLSTSGTYQRVWHRDKKKIHHILSVDSNNNPDTNILSASIITSNGAFSDALATATIAQKSNTHIDRLLHDESTRYLIITNNGTISKTV